MGTDLPDYGMNISQQFYPMLQNCLTSFLLFAITVIMEIPGFIIIGVQTAVGSSFYFYWLETVRSRAQPTDRQQ